MVAESIAAGNDEYYRQVRLRSLWIGDVGFEQYPDAVFCTAMERLAFGRAGLAAAGQVTPYYKALSFDHYLDDRAGLSLGAGMAHMFDLAEHNYAPALIELARLYEEGVVLARSSRAAYALLQIAGAPAEANEMNERLAEQLSPQERERLARFARLYKEGILSRIKELASPEIWVEEPALLMEGDCRRLEEAAIRNSFELRHLIAPTALESLEQRGQRYEAARYWRHTRGAAEYPGLAICDDVND